MIELAEIRYRGPRHVAYMATSVLCPDGIRRTATNLSEPDTYFSIPATVKAYGKSVRGFITGTEGPDGDWDYKFVPYEYCKNSYVFDFQPD